MVERPLLAALAAAVALGCTQRASVEELELVEPDIAVVPDEAPQRVSGKVVLHAGLLSTKRLPGAAYRALMELLEYRERTRATIYDRPIRELVKIACEHDDPAVLEVLEQASIEELFPLERIAGAHAAGCGVLFVQGKAVRGPLFEEACFAKRLAALNEAQATGLAPSQVKCPVPRRDRPKPEARPPLRLPDAGVGGSLGQSAPNPPAPAPPVPELAPTRGPS